MSFLMPIDLLLLLCRTAVGGVLLLAGCAKVHAGPAWFVHALLGYDLLPRRLAIPIARSLPWVEIGCGLALLTGSFTPSAAMVALGLMLVFAAVISSAILRQKAADCGCFGPLQRSRVNRPRWLFIYRNLVLAGLAIPVCTAGAGTLALDALIGWQWPTFEAQTLWWGWGLTLALTLALHRLGNWRFERELGAPETAAA